jgi:hypothetical protein
MAAKETRNLDSEIVEHGDIYFFYRPKVETEHPEGIDDVQRFHIVLRQHGKALFRLITIARKRLPDIGEHERTWGFVDMVADSARAIEQALRERKYQTKTRGERTLPVARPAGEGVYAVVRGRQQALSRLRARAAGETRRSPDRIEDPTAGKLCPLDQKS